MISSLSATWVPRRAPRRPSPAAGGETAGEHRQREMAVGCGDGGGDPSRAPGRGWLPSSPAAIAATEAGSMSVTVTLGGGVALQQTCRQCAVAGAEFEDLRGSGTSAISSSTEVGELVWWLPNTRPVHSNASTTPRFDGGMRRSALIQVLGPVGLQEPVQARGIRAPPRGMRSEVGHAAQATSRPGPWGLSSNACRRRSMIAGQPPGSRRPTTVRCRPRR